jgi:GNAT superfamily N-acetyltransferase
VTLPVDVVLRAPVPGDEHSIAALVGACDESYRDWTPPGWQPPPAGRELDRWRGRILDGSWWTRVAVEPTGRVVGLVCFGQALEQRAAGELLIDPIPGRAHVSAVFTHPGRWREGIARALLAVAEDRMRAEGYREVQLWTPRDAPARRFYEATGWRHDGRTQFFAELQLPLVAYLKPL